MFPIPQKISERLDNDQARMPFLESLNAEKARRQISFHMPGHKMVLPPPDALLEYWGGDLQPADLVEISGMIDYLHAPRGALKEAQELAARAYGADHTFWLINGSTVGNIGAVMSVAGDGDVVIMARASHRSVYSGVVLSGAVPCYIPPDYHPRVGFPLASDPKVVADLLAQHSQAVAVHVTSPNYYGYMSDTARLAALAHAQGAALLVDEAHGSHLGFHEDLPQSAARLGADLVIQSTHKTQSALTQASMLQVNEGYVDVARVAQVLAVLQSSSPSSILLASLDAARMVMATQGRALLDKALNLAQEARETIRQIDGMWCFGEDIVGEHGIFTYDPTKLVVRVIDTGWSGYQVFDKLRYEHGIDVESADLRTIICSITIGDTPQMVSKLLSGLQAIASEKPPQAQKAVEIDAPSELPTMALTPRQAFFARSRVLPAEAAVGQAVAEYLIPYPPGIPLVAPGEVLTRETLDYLRTIKAVGGKMVGPQDASLSTIRCIDDRRR
ncbi:MAG: aminotransferase class I/II-fold pyridoxal phosphate-dependent enzyme [Anaerolineae bacterium]|nr:aminotransferase class I/II-fold pyridoxal phosphate-dependent enzyme [Anaerolineae bacterium]MDW8173040.1 aminotransferase class I/II-fold pyridoxal phosphate-dependent enzyme [Anaerolineae bacterium]